MILNIFTDGASKGNPGKAGAGVAIYSKGDLVDTISSYLGIKTNNEAEYFALIRALEWIDEKKKKGIRIERVNVFADSQLVVKQMKGEYKVKAEKVIPLYEYAKSLCEGLEIKFNWIRREENSVADELANKALE